MDKESVCNAGDTGDVGSISVGTVPWRRKQQPTSVFLPEKSQGQRSLACCSPKGHKKSDTTERLSVHIVLHNINGLQYFELFSIDGYFKVLSYSFTITNNLEIVH